MIEWNTKAPTRIDLGGGTVDLWPIYLMLPGASTLNLAIDLYAQAHFRFESTSNSPGVRIRSEDQGAEVTLDWEAIFDPEFEKLHPHAVSPFALLPFKICRFFSQRRLKKDPALTRGHLEIVTKAKSPAGAGLGGSSTLAIALIAGLERFGEGVGEELAPVAALHAEFQRRRWVEIAKDIESTLIEVPAGLQDYYGAAFGGLQWIKWGVLEHEREALSKITASRLGSQILLFYSGQSRNSGINNWALFQSFLNKEKATVQGFQEIVRVTRDLALATKNSDYKNVRLGIEAEWNARRKLAPGISTPEIDQAFMKASKITPISGKVCGAGGGGCFFIFTENSDPELKARITQAVVNDSIRTLEFGSVSE